MKPSRRQINLLGFVCCAGLMAYALYAEHVLLLTPCPLCVFQRLAVISLGLIFLAASLHDPSGPWRIGYAVLLSFAGLAGAAVAGWHVRLQHLPSDQIPSCGPGLEYMLETFPLGEALRMVFSGSGECASLDWQFLGLSMPAWVFASVVVLTGAGVRNNLRRS